MDTNVNTVGDAPRRKFQNEDPQTTVTGRLKPGSKTEIIVFTIVMDAVEIVAIANIPLEGATEAPVYLKWKVKNPNEMVYTTDRPIKTNDLQTIVQGKLKSGENNDMIVATIPLGLFELVCIINIPFNEMTEAPVYVKWKVKHPSRAQYI